MKITKKETCILKENVPLPYLVEFGIMNRKGKILKSNEFIQIQEFLNLVQQMLPNKKKLTVVEYCCGKSFLTFALYDLLSRRYEVTMYGIDKDKSTINESENIARKLGMKGLFFYKGSVDDFFLPLAIDIIVAFHACDTAADAVIEKGIRENSKMIMVVPCCHRDLYKQIKNASLKLLLYHDILKQRFTALVTDAVRAALLVREGYDVELLEFVDPQLNFFIRAVKRKRPVAHPLKSYKDLKELLHIYPDLEKRLSA